RTGAVSTVGPRRAASGAPAAGRESRRTFRSLRRPHTRVRRCSAKSHAGPRADQARAAARSAPAPRRNQPPCVLRLASILRLAPPLAALQPHGGTGPLPGRLPAVLQRRVPFGPPHAWRAELDALAAQVLDVHPRGVHAGV